MLIAPTSCDVEFENPSQWVRTSICLEKKENVVSTEPENEKDFQFVLVDGKLIHKKEIPAHYQSTLQRYQSTLTGIENHIKQIIEIMHFPQQWIDDGVDQPSKLANEIAFKTAIDIFSEQKLLPSFVRPSVEEGILLTYWNNYKQRSLKVEIYNDGETAGLINQEKEILTCVDIESSEDLKSLVENFIS